MRKFLPLFLPTTSIPKSFILKHFNYIRICTLRPIEILVQIVFYFFSFHLFNFFISRKSFKNYSILSLFQINRFRGSNLRCECGRDIFRINHLALERGLSGGGPAKREQAW